MDMSIMTQIFRFILRLFLYQDFDPDSSESQMDRRVQATQKNLSKIAKKQLTTGRKSVIIPLVMATSQ